MATKAVLASGNHEHASSSENEIRLVYTELHRTLDHIEHLTRAHIHKFNSTHEYKATGIDTHKCVVLRALRRLGGVGRDHKYARGEVVAVAKDLLEVERALRSSLRRDHLGGERDT